MMTLHRNFLVILTVFFLAGFWIFNFWQETLLIQDLSVLDATETKTDPDITVKLHSKKKKPPKQIAKGIYLTAYSAGNSKKINSIIDLIDKTELNSVVIDIKDYSGLILYDSEIETVRELGLIDNRIGSIKDLIEKLHENDIYVIARQTVFQDPALARAKPEWAIKTKQGGVWYDYKGLSWVDPTRKEVWGYNIEIAREAMHLGFDEINFDYVRFPTDGNLSSIKYANEMSERVDVMGDFYEYLGTELGREPAWISLDLFGLVMENHTGLGIGQRLVDAVAHVDYISPMMYPSHYPPGHLGLSNPANSPAPVIENGMKKGSPYFEGKKAEVRPWLQAFNLGAVYDAGKIRAQIDMVEKYPNAGWFLWNASNRYTAAGLKLE